MNANPRDTRFVCILIGSTSHELSYFNLLGVTPYGSIVDQVRLLSLTFIFRVLSLGGIKLTGVEYSNEDQPDLEVNQKASDRHVRACAYTCSARTDHRKWHNLECGKCGHYQHWKKLKAKKLERDPH